MRFDYRGMGDSSGAMRDFECVGADIGAALYAFKNACPELERVVLWGLCAAASASLMYLESTGGARVGGPVMLNPWVLSDESFARSQIRHHYVRRALQLDFWQKLLRGRVGLVGPLHTLKRALNQNAGTRLQDTSYQSIMARTMAAYAGPVLIVLSGRDPTARGFLDYCGKEASWHGLIDRPNVEQHSVPDADHTFCSSRVARRRRIRHARLVAAVLPGSLRRRCSVEYGHPLAPGW